VAREAHVELGDAFGVVRGQRDVDLLVDVEPLGVVIELLGDQRRAAHEAPRLIEIGERERTKDGVAPVDLLPVRQFFERLFGADLLA
jgi:hypothetical protein